MKNLIKYKDKIILGLSIISLIIGLILKFISSDSFSWMKFFKSEVLSNTSITSTFIFLFGALILYPEIIEGFIEDIKKKNFFNENLLMLISTLGAIILSELMEGALILILKAIGEIIEDKAKERAKKSLEAVINKIPLKAHLVIDNQITDINPTEVKIDNIIEVRPGERIVADGLLLSNEADIDLSTLTGESEPKKYSKNDLILSGGIVINKTIQLKIQKQYEDSTFAKLINLIEEQDKTKSKSEKFMNKFSKFYIPSILIISLIVLFVGLIINNFNLNNSLGYFRKSISIILIGCPCSLIISIPLIFVTTIHKASKMGIIIKGANHIENLAKCQTFAFDKTGTLTKGNFQILNLNDISKDHLNIISSLEKNTNHPISRIIANLENIELLNVTNFEEIAGKGISGTIKNKKYYLGNKKFLKEITNINEEENLYTTLYLFDEKELLTKILIDDEIKPEASECINNLKKEDVDNLMIISGDSKQKVEKVASYLGINNYYYDLLPQNKLDIIKNNNLITYVGDGINDSPSLIASTVGISMGKIGSDLALESSDIIICNDSLNKICETKRLAKHTMKKIYIGVILTLILKLTILALVLTGILSNYVMLISSISDTGILLLSILYAILIVKYKPKYIK